MAKESIIQPYSEIIKVDEAFEDYMGKNGVNERKTMVASSKVPEKKPEKR